MRDAAARPPARLRCGDQKGVPASCGVDILSEVADANGENPADAATEPEKLVRRPDLPLLV